MTGRRRIWATLFTVPSVLVLLGLGTWQVQRLEWKRDLIAEREARLSAPALSIEEVRGDPKPYALRRVSAAGVFLHDRELQVVSKTRKGRPGVHVITPLRLDDGSVVMINRGWVPLDRVDPASRAAGNVEARTKIEGVLRLGMRPSRWIPDNQPDKGVWYYVDPAAMGAHHRIARVRPYLIEAGAAPNPGGFPIGGQTVTRIANNHLQYAITWYSLAVALVVIYLLFLRRSRRA